MRAIDISTMALLAVVSAAMVGALYLIFLVAPDERAMGAVQRLFYLHVPSAFVAFASTFVMLGAAVAYLWTRRRIWDDVARAAAELALLFCAVVLVTGPIWAKPAWGVWWTWEAKLTTTLLLALLLAASLMVRRYAESAEQGARIAAVLSIVAALDVPIIYKAVDWWRGQHPLVFGPGKKDALDPRMAGVFLASLATFFALYGLLLLLSTRIATLEGRARDLAEGGRAQGGLRQ